VVSLVRSACNAYRGLIVFSGQELDNLLNVVIHQVDAEQLAGAGSHANGELHFAGAGPADHGDEGTHEPSGALR
jgi:hypothetical protein